MAESVHTGSKWVALNSTFSLWCCARGNVSPCIILFIASLFIFSYCTCHPPISVYHFLASEGVYCLAFCLQSPQLNNNLYHHELGFYFAKELILHIIMCGGVETRGHKVPLQGSHTVELDIM